MTDAWVEAIMASQEHKPGCDVPDKPCTCATEPPAVLADQQTASASFGPALLVETTLDEAAKNKIGLFLWRWRTAKAFIETAAIRLAAAQEKADAHKASLHQLLRQLGYNPDRPIEISEDGVVTYTDTPQPTKAP